MNSFGNCDVAFETSRNQRRAARFRSGRRMRGASTTQLAIAVLVVALVALAAWWFLGQRGTVPSIVPAAPKTSVATPGTPQAAAPAPAAELTVDQLFKEARTAMADKRVASPPGNNALEDYIKVLDKQPGDASATDALRELFPFATDTVQEQINSGNYDEANRIIGLLAKADPSNYTLTILRSKLDAKKKLDERDQQQLAQKAAAAAALAAQKSAAPTAASETAPANPAGTPEANTAEAAAAPAAAPKAPPKVARSTPAPVAAPPSAPAAPVGETRDVRVVKPPQPVYPAAAARNRQDGSVEVEFTVAADGSVQNAKVVSSSSRVFDSSALSAIKGAKFEAKLENGQPVASTLRRRIDFKLGQ